MDENRTKELLHWLFRQRETFVCRQSDAQELKRVVQDVGLVLQGFSEQNEPNLINAVVRQLRKNFKQDKICLDATSLYITRLDCIIQAKTEVAA